MPKLLTAAAIEKLKPSPHKRREVRDGGASGLYVCIQTSGHKSWVLRGRRPDGRQGKVTLGTVDLSRRDKGEPVLGAPLTLTAARVLANQLLRAKAQGIDVAEQKIELSKKRLGGDTFADVAIGFIEDHCRPKNRGWRATARVLGLDYPKDGGEPELLRNGLARRWAAKSITQVDAAAIHAVIAESRRRGIPGSTPKGDADPSESRGRAVAAALGKLFSWATQHRLVTVNPCLGMYRPKPPSARHRVLTQDEIKSLWEACNDVAYPFGTVIKLLLITAQRRDEIAEMQWSELSEDFATWNIPAARTKNARPHQLFLPKVARDIIASVPRRVGSDFVFTTTGVTPISGFSKAKLQFDDLMEAAEPWRIHDLRRTAVTGMAELGVTPHVIEAVVNHISGHKGGVAGVYNRAAYAAEKKAALALWADHVSSVAGHR